MFPEAFLERMNHLLGDEYESFLAALRQERCQALRLNSLKCGEKGFSATEVFGGADESALGEQTVNSFAHLTKVPWAENGYYYEMGDQPGKHPCHEAGLYYIQEPSAMVPAELLDVKPGKRVLDLCAAPGGKSTQLAAMLKGEGLLVCNEIHAARAKILSENVERMGIGNACVTNETPQRLAEFFPGFFDRILVDAPCSGEGMFRKNQAACEEWSPENVALCGERQVKILECAAAMLRPGGKLVYSTCTFAPLENEGSVSRFLRRHEEFELLPIDKEKLGLKGCDGVPQWGDNRPELAYALRLWPHKIRGEGHFAAALQKVGNTGQNGSAAPANGWVKGVSRKELGEFERFCQENLHFPGEDLLEEICDAVGLARDALYVRSGDNLYLVPARMPETKGLKVLRPGLHLGQWKKNRFEPSHGLALALRPDRAVHVWRFSSEDPTVSAYLNGQTFSAAGEKGWYLICVEGFSLGWGKLAGGVMKNHYPRGLRVNP